MSQVSSTYLRGFVSGSTLLGCSRGKSLETCERFDRLRIWIP